jgi:hypothetical protein
LAAAVWPLVSWHLFWHAKSSRTSNGQTLVKTFWTIRATLSQQSLVKATKTFDLTVDRVVSSTAITPTIQSPRQQQHVITYEGIAGLDLLAGSILEGNHACEAIADFREQTKRMRPITVLINVTFGCQDYYEHSSIGSGNVLLALYMMRASFALLGNVELHFVCHDGHPTQSQLILPWFTGTWYFGASITRNLTLQQEACAPFWGAVLDHVYRDMQSDLRRMATSLVGTTTASVVRGPFAALGGAAAAASAPTLSNSSSSSSSTTFVPYLPSIPNEQPPLFKNVDLDDAVIHFRCGDLLASNLPGYGFWTFDGYVRHISSEAKSIGILTQPFPENNTNVQQRYMDNADAAQNRRCKTLALALRDYIQERHPHATVSIRNTKEETIALSMARLVLANQSIGGRSTFSVFPIVATYGTGYYLQPEILTPCSWLGRLDPHLLVDPDTGRHNVILFDEPHQRIGSHVSALRDSNGNEAVLDWFKS